MVSACTSDNTSEEKNTSSTISQSPIETEMENNYTETENPLPKHDIEYYKDKLSQLFPFPDENLQYYKIIRGSLDIKSTEGNYFSAQFLDDELRRYDLTIFGEMGKAEYRFYINEGFMFLYYQLTECPEPFVADNAKEYITRFVAENDELLVYDLANEEIQLFASISDEEQRIFNNALDYKQKILNNEFEKEDWVEAFADLIQYGDIYGHFQEIHLIDVDFDGIPELFLTMSSITGGYRHWISQGFAYKNGMITDIKCSLPKNLELYRNKETNEILWIADGVDENFVSNPIMEFSFEHYWIEADFSDITKTEWSTLFLWKEEYTTVYGVDDSKSESVFTLIGYFDEDRIISKAEIDELKNELFSRYEYIDTIKIIGDAQKFGLVNWTDGKEFPRDELLALLRSYDEQK